MIFLASAPRRARRPVRTALSRRVLPAPQLFGARTSASRRYATGGGIEEVAGALFFAFIYTGLTSIPNPPPRFESRDSVRHLCDHRVCCPNNLPRPLVRRDPSHKGKYTHSCARCSTLLLMRHPPCPPTTSVNEPQCRSTHSEACPHLPPPNPRKGRLPSRPPSRPPRRPPSRTHTHTTCSCPCFKYQFSKSRIRCRLQSRT